ncbi:hypothetical protein ACTJKN_26020 [Pedobacter sp. 22163]|uniref:hypothetical protein n=1 Tax=Pedobacter sp. 22163 TaxID=3453883 RepID=UPI003F87FCCD
MNKYHQENGYNKIDKFIIGSFQPMDFLLIPYKPRIRAFINGHSKLEILGDDDYIRLNY